jgi:hypothetical protein
MDIRDPFVCIISLSNIVVVMAMSNFGSLACKTWRACYCTFLVCIQSDNSSNCIVSFKNFW